MARICIITQDPSLGGGVATKLAAFLKYADQRGHVCDLYFPVSKLAQDVELEMLHDVDCVDQLYPIKIPQNIPHFISAAIFARRCKINKNYDAYQLVAGSLYQGLPFVNNNRGFVAWIAGTHASDVRATPRTKIRHYFFYNPLANELIRRQELASANKAQAIMAVSRYSVQELSKGLGVAEHKMRVLPVPVDLDRFHVGKSVMRPARYVLSVARLDRRKDFATLLKAFHLVSESINDIHLHIVGDGREQKNLVMLTKELGLQDKVLFLGAVEDSELIDEYCGASLFTLASRQEGLGIVFLEAMASGLPIVATNSGGSADPIIHGETGYLVPVGDWQNLANYIIHILCDPLEMERLGHAARERALNVYQFEKIFAEFDTVYAKVFGIYS